MALKLRMTRMGAKKKPFYRIVALDSQNRRDGKVLDFVGHYNPMTTPVDVTFQEDKVKIWLERGATPSDTVRSLLKKAGLVK